MKRNARLLFVVMLGCAQHAIAAEPPVEPAPAMQDSAPQAGQNVRKSRYADDDEGVKLEWRKATLTVVPSSEEAARAARNDPRCLMGTGSRLIRKGDTSKIRNCSIASGAVYTPWDGIKH